MHQTAFQHAKDFAQTLPQTPLVILELGAFDAQDGRGNLRPIFARGVWSYRGADIRPGAGIDLVLADPYDWPELADGSIDVVVSTSTLEHVARPWRWLEEQVRIVKPGGWVYCCVPGVCEYHPSPLDCWRVFPEGLSALFAEVGLLTEHVFQAGSSEPGQTDTVGIARRPC